MATSAPTLKRATLAGVALFEGLSEQDLARVQRLCAWHDVPPGAVILRHKDPTTDVVFMISGRARVIIYSADGKQVAFREIRAGDTFGELAAIDGEPRSAGVEAVEPSLMASLPAASFRELIAGVPVIRDNLFKHLVTLVRSLTGRVVEQSTLVVRQRVHTELLRLALEEPMADGVVCLKPAPNIEEMANRIGARREGVNRIVSELKEEGILERRGRALVVLDLDRLRSKVQSATGE